tara:strand:+ start:150 stop:479 length:330 start_codon:yes stop_codon:yes gene_type:complete
MDILDREQKVIISTKRETVFVFISIFLYQFFVFYEEYDSLNGWIENTSALLATLSFIAVPSFFTTTLILCLRVKFKKFVIHIIIFTLMLAYQVFFVIYEITKEIYIPAH